MKQNGLIKNKHDLQLIISVNEIINGVINNGYIPLNEGLHCRG